MKNISGIIGEFTGEKTDYHVAEMAASDCSSEKGESTSSLLGRLKFPEPSELARKREVKANPPVRVKRIKPATVFTKAISIADATCEGEFGLTVWFFIENNRWLSWE